MAIDRATASANVDRLIEHIKQVETGAIPEDAPFEFAKSETPDTDALDERGLPWWFGPDYKPTAPGSISVTIGGEAQYDDEGKEESDEGVDSLDD